MSMELFREGQILKHKRRDICARLSGILRMERKHVMNDDPHWVTLKLKPTFRYILRSMNGHQVEVLNARKLSANWRIAFDPGTVPDDSRELRKELRKALKKENYERCAVLRDKLNTLKT